MFAPGPHLTKLRPWLQSPFFTTQNSGPPYVFCTRPLSCKAITVPPYFSCTGPPFCNAITGCTRLVIWIVLSLDTLSVQIISCRSGKILILPKFIEFVGHNSKDFARREFDIRVTNFLFRHSGVP